MSKVIAIVSFRLPQKQTLAQATETFQATAPKYLGVPGLLRKNYFLTEDGMRAGGIYLWESRQAAESVYTPEWKDFVKGKYGNEPEIVYVDTPGYWWTTNRAGSRPFEPALLSALRHAADAGRSGRRQPHGLPGGRLRLCPLGQPDPGGGSNRRTRGQGRAGTQPQLA